MKILETYNLSKVYNNETHALNGVSFSVSVGEFISIIGPSGAGKSTLLRCINHLIDPTSGAVDFMETPVNVRSKKDLRLLRSEIGMVFQNYNLVSRLSVLESVLHGRLGHMSTVQGLLGLYSEQDKKEAIALLIELGLEEEIYKRADELSGGQMQCVNICRALAQKPKLMLADEPIASLDPKTSKDVMERLHATCQEKGIACIANLHQVDVAKRYSSRIIGVKKRKNRI